MRILVTGASGFVGQHLLTYLKHIQPDAELFGTYLNSEPTGDAAYSRVDLRQPDEVATLVNKTGPDAIYHLAGQASPSRSFKQPWDTLETNIRAQFNVLQACIDLKIQPRILTISSAEVYGAVRPDDLPLRETSPLRPSSPYSLSKITQDMMGWQYFLSYQLPVIRVRPFNHTGAGQSEDFAVASFAMQIARIEAGQQEPVIRVGNLSPQRDFTDVRDVVRAYHRIMNQGTPGDVYHIASGNARSIQSILDTLVSMAAVPITVEVDAARVRPVDTPVMQGDYSRLAALTGWQPEIPFEQTLHDLLNDWRQRVRLSIRS